jgi:type IV secretion system protein VirB4
LELEKPTIGFDLTSILDDPAVRTPWLMYIFHRLGDFLNGEKLMIILDEGWKLLDDPAFALQLKDWMKTIRKANGLVGFATQSPSDAINSSVGPTILEQSTTQIFLPNLQARQSDYCHGFGLSPREFALIKELSPESRCFLIKQGSSSIVVKLDLSQLEFFMPVLSGRREHLSIMAEAMEEFGSDPEEWLSPFLERVAQHD